jgi:DNA-binding response OmpR family regulator
MTSPLPDLFTTSLNDLAAQTGIDTSQVQHSLSGTNLILRTPSQQGTISLPLPLKLADLISAWQSISEADSGLELAESIHLRHTPPHVQHPKGTIDLTASEHAILLALAQKPKGTKRSLLLKEALGSNLTEDETDLLESHLYRLRKKLRLCGLTLESQRGTIRAVQL